jgi:hypothetical protein
VTIYFEQIHTAELLIPDSGPFGVEIATAKLKRYNHQVVIKFGRTYSSRR